MADTVAITVVEPKRKITLPCWRKCLFAFGGLPFQMLSNVIGFFLSIFLLEVARLDPFLISIIILSGRAWDALTDPIVGLLVERTDTRMGKLKPWIGLSCPLACCTFFLLWYVPAPFYEDTTGSTFVAFWKFFYYLVVYLLFQTFITCHHVPYTSLTMFITDCQRDRDSATAFRMAFELVGTLVGSALSGTIVSFTRVASSEECDQRAIWLAANVTGNATGFNQTAFVQQFNISEASRQRERYGYILSSTCLCGIYVASVLCVCFGVREYRAITVLKERREPFFLGLKRVLSFRPYVILMLAFLFISLGLQVVQGNLALYCTHSLRLGDHLAYAILVLLGTAILLVPFWMFMVHRFGKKCVFKVGIALFVPVLIACLFIPANNLVWFYALYAFSGAGVSVAFLLPWSMLPDVIDEYFLETGEKHAAVFYSFYVFFNKLATGVSLALSQVVLGIVGYRTDARCAWEQPEAVGWAMRVLFSGPSLACYAVGYLFVHYYPIDEARRAENRERMNRVRQFEPESPSSEFESEQHLVTAVQKRAERGATASVDGDVDAVSKASAPSAKCFSEPLADALLGDPKPIV